MNHAVSVGYARHLVAWLFSLWPKDQRITKSYLNNIDACKVVGLFDLIQEAEHKEHFEKVVFFFSVFHSIWNSKLNVYFQRLSSLILDIQSFCRIPYLNFLSILVQLVFNFVRLCDKELVKPLALSAVHCMGEVQLASHTIESEHKYKHNCRLEV